MKHHKRYEYRILGLFLVLLIIYLFIAYFIHAPRGYYGSIEQPRFADPWIARTETILNGGLLYRDVFTTTPPLTNLLLIPPSLAPIYLGNVNPWATLSYMIYFSLFNLLGAYVLLYMGETKKEGFTAAVLFLLNPLTFGNTVLRRQDESIIVFFIGLALFFILKRKHMKAAVAIGISLLVKLSGGILIPIAFLHSWNWRYLVIPILVFLIVLAPFLILAGQDAIFWNVNTAGGQHPFQYRGVSLFNLWNEFHEESQHVPLALAASLLFIGVGGAAAVVVWKRPGVLEEIALLVTAAFIFSPKVHTGYFSILALTMAPLLKNWRAKVLYLLVGGLAIVADFYKWPIINYQIAFNLMVVTLLMLAALSTHLFFTKRPALQ